MVTSQTTEGFVNIGTSYKVKDFPKGTIITFKDNEDWIVVKAGMRKFDNRVKLDEITIKPYNDLAKKKNISLPIDIDLCYLNANVIQIR